MERGLRKRRIGVVISNKMDKTIVVKSERLIQEPFYKKIIRRSTTYKVHDEKNQSKTGDTVEIMETRPLSKTKHWRLLRIMEKK